MRLAGIHGDGLISDPVSYGKWKPHWEDGARSVGKNPADMPVLIEQYVVVGDEAAAQRPAELWRFGPHAWKIPFDVPSPVEIQQKAATSTPIKEVLKSWVVSTDPNAHIQKIRELYGSGVSIVNIHAPQQDQVKGAGLLREARAAEGASAGMKPVAGRRHGRPLTAGLPSVTHLLHRSACRYQRRAQLNARWNLSNTR